MKRATILFVILFGVSLLLFACQPTKVASPDELFQPEEDTTNNIIQLEAKPTIYFTKIPGTIHGDEIINIYWEIGSELSRTITHTAIHYDIKSHPETFTFEDGPQDSGYPFLTTEYTLGNFSVPGEFTAGFIVPNTANNIYFRAHAIIDGKNYWTEEQSIGIVRIGCTFNNPECNSSGDCINNQCVLKTGCAYSNPPCGSGFRCRNNECIRMSSGGGGGY